MIHAASLPRLGDQRLFHLLYTAGDLVLDPEAVASIVKGYECKYMMFPSSKSLIVDLNLTLLSSQFGPLSPSMPSAASILLAL